MASQNLQRDANRVTVLGAVTDDSNQFIQPLQVNPATGRLLVSAVGVTALAVQVENPSGTVNGVNTTFTVLNTPIFAEVSGQVMVSQAQDATNYGYSYSAGTITFVNPPTQTPHTFYNGSSGITVSSFFQTDTFTSTNNQTVFTSSLTPLFVLSVIVNDQPLTLTTDYTLSGSTFTLNAGIPAGLNVVITYIHA